MLCRGEDGERQLMSKVLFSGPSQGYICASIIHQGHQHTCDPEKHWKLYYSHKWSDLRDEYKKRIKPSRGSSPAVPRSSSSSLLCLPSAHKAAVCTPWAWCCWRCVPVKGEFFLPTANSVYVQCREPGHNCWCDQWRRHQTDVDYFCCCVICLFLGVYVHKLWPELLFTEN